MKQVLLFLFLIGSSLSAQQNIQKCYTNEYINFLDQNNSGLKAGIQSTFDLAKAYAENQAHHKSTNGVFDTIFRIPVVFHVVYNGSIQNVDESLLQSQLVVLNEDFNRFNSDTGNTRAIFKNRASGVGFEFFLATIDPDGNPSNGITRTPTTSSFSFFNLDDMKKAGTGKEAWDTDEYLNIWVCDLGGLILGFAYPPAAAPNWPTDQSPSSSAYEGVVIHYEVIGRNNPLATGQLAIANKGRTAVHEVGHFWGLRHIWGDSGSPFSNAPDCDLTKDDGFSDTPHMGNNSQSSGCSFSKNSCSNGETPDEPDMVENYMDYSTETCQNMFTQQQANLIRSMAVLGRPNIPNLIVDETIVVSIGEWIVINNTDTVFLDGNTSVTITIGDQVMFLNENNGYNYTATNNYLLDGNDEAMLTEDGNVSFSAGPNGLKEGLVSLLKVYPNPAKDIVEVSNPNALKINQVRIFSISGQELINQEVSDTNFKISTQNLSNGVYFLQFENQSKIIGIKKLNILR